MCMWPHLRLAVTRTGGSNYSIRVGAETGAQTPPERLRIFAIQIDLGTPRHAACAEIYLDRKKSKPFRRSLRPRLRSNTDTIVATPCTDVTLSQLICCESTRSVL